MEVQSDRNSINITVMFMINIIAYVYGTLRPVVITQYMVEVLQTNPELLMFTHKTVTTAPFGGIYDYQIDLYPQYGPLGIFTLILIFAIVGVLVSLIDHRTRPEMKNLRDSLFSLSLILEILFIANMLLFKNRQPPFPNSFASEQVTTILFPGFLIILALLIKILYLIFPAVKSPFRRIREYQDRIS